MQNLHCYTYRDFLIYMSKLYYYISNNLKTLLDNQTLKPNFTKSIFPAATFNIRLKIMTHEHVNCYNLAFVQCLIQASGSFNLKAEGHFIFYNFKIAVKFLLGSTILMPSSTFKYSNIQIATSDKRVSIIQYYPKRLIKQVRYRFQPATVFTKKEKKINSSIEYQVKKRLGQWSKAAKLIQNKKGIVKKGGKKVC